MNECIFVLKSIFNDSFIFPLFELVLFVIVVIAIVKEGKTKGKSSISTRPSEKKWESDYPFAYGVATLVLIQIINSAETLKGYKTIISFSNLLALTYLTFFSSWFRIKIESLIEKSKNKLIQIKS